MALIVLEPMLLLVPTASGCAIGAGAASAAAAIAAA